MILASHQPDFFPYMGYFYKIFKSDIFVFSDNVLYSKTGRHNYNSILTGQGVRKLTLPIHYHVVNLNEMQIAADDKWIDKTLKTLWQEYRKCEHYAEGYRLIANLLERTRYAKSLASFNIACIEELSKRFGIWEGRKFYLSSDLDLKNRKDARVIEMCELLGADCYYSGSGAKDYHIEADYSAKGIDLKYTDYVPAIYPQNNGPKTGASLYDSFVADMSVIDYIMNCGFVLPWGWNKE